MNAVSEQVREAVVRRANNRCEYCQLPAQFQISGFEIDHILPRSRGGQSELTNLALACPHCNARKWAHTDGEDSESGQLVALFNPRMQTWEDHFRWSEEPHFMLVGVSTCGRATIARLQMNHPDLVSIRRLLDGLGISWKVGV
jgi:hypothetical protein